MLGAVLLAVALAAAPASVAPAPRLDPAAAATAARAAARLEFPADTRIPDAPVMNPHDEGGRPYCAWCHEGRDPAVKGDPVALCAQCHPPSIMKHPYGVVAKQVPAALPLAAGGKIVCHTCHDPHDVKAHRKGLRLELVPLCEQCHARHGNGPKVVAPGSTRPSRR